MGDLRSQSDLFQIVASFFAQANAVRPLVLLLEDLHWADQASLDLLRYLARAVGAQRLLLVVTYRDDEVGRGHRLAQLLPALVREAATRHLTLPPLATPAVRELVAADYELPSDDVDRLVGYVQSRAEGGPFFMSEVLRSLEDAGALNPEGNGWQLGQPGSGPSVRARPLGHRGAACTVPGRGAAAARGGGDRRPRGAGRPLGDSE